MSERALTTPGQDGGPQTRWLCGDDHACLETTSPDAPGQSHRFDRHTAPAPFASSGSLRVQWDSTALPQRLFTRDA